MGALTETGWGGDEAYKVFGANTINNEILALPPKLAPQSFKVLTCNMGPLTPVPRES